MHIHSIEICNGLQSTHNKISKTNEVKYAEEKTRVECEWSQVEWLPGYGFPTILYNHQPGARMSVPRASPSSFLFYCHQVRWTGVSLLPLPRGLLVHLPSWSRGSIHLPVFPGIILVSLLNILGKLSHTIISYFLLLSLIHSPPNKLLYPSPTLRAFPFVQASNSSQESGN